jgi:CheY-like chemotaxis protein
MDKKEIFKKFLETNEVLIVDKNPSSRNRLLKTMSDLGAGRHIIHTASSIQECEEPLKTRKIGIVLSDYFIGGGSGFDLFKIVREKKPENKELCLVLVTANISQTAVAKAAEEDVDSFIIKPYTIQSIQENLISTVTSKVKPSDYILKIEEAKELVKGQKYDEAIQVLQEAMKLHSRPALALFYIGQAEYLKDLIHNATGSYKKGLNFNNIHYKCLLGLYELFIKEQKYLDAYEVVKKISKYFPANPDRLAQVVRLAVRTENFEDMQIYYDIFTSLDERNALLTNYIGAGMYIAGKHALLKNETDLAIRYFDNIAVSCSEFTKFLRAMITVLIEHERADLALKYLSRFPAGNLDQEDYLVSEYLLQSKTLTDYGTLIKIGLDIYNRKIRDCSCLKVLVMAMENQGYKEDKIAPYRKELKELSERKSRAS